MKKKILVVDDEPYIVEMIKLRLEEEGYNVKTANSGEKSFVVALNFNPDLIIMDWILDSGISGIEAIKKLKSIEETSVIPILVLTGKTLDEDKDEALKAGATSFISKPILPSQLIECIDKYLK